MIIFSTKERFMAEQYLLSIILRHDNRFTAGRTTLRMLQDKTLRQQIPLCTRWVSLSCRVKANCPHVGPGPTWWMTCLGAFLRDPNPYLIYASFREKPQKLRKARPTSATGDWTWHFLSISFRTLNRATTGGNKNWQFHIHPRRGFEPLVQQTASLTTAPLGLRVIFGFLKSNLYDIGFLWINLSRKIISWISQNIFSHMNVYLCPDELTDMLWNHSQHLNQT